MRSPERLRAEFERLHGYWDERLQALLDLDPRLFAVHAGLVGVAERHGVLPTGIRHLVHLAVAVAATHLYGPGIEQHFRNALRHGASSQELLAVLQIASTLGTHGVLEGALTMARVRNGASATTDQEDT